MATAIEQAQRRLDALVASARQGRSFTAAQLLAIQADTYRFSQTIDIAARVVEHGVQSIKQTLQTPV
jgi:hypothetical protein